MWELLACINGWPVSKAAHSWIFQDFASLQLSEINHNIQSRRNKIFLLMEEVRRLRIQQRLKVCSATPAVLRELCRTCINTANKI